MPADTLCFDYAQDTFSNTFQVTAAQNREVDTLLTLANALRLRLAAIAPDAGALANLLCCCPRPVRRPERSTPVAMGDASPVGRRYTTEAATVNELAALLALSSSDIAVFDAARDPRKR